MDKKKMSSILFPKVDRQKLLENSPHRHESDGIPAVCPMHLVFSGMNTGAHVSFHTIVHVEVSVHRI